jgi:hypothetical protein
MQRKIIVTTPKLTSTLLSGLCCYKLRWEFAVFLCMSPIAVATAAATSEA